MKFPSIFFLFTIICVLKVETFSPTIYLNFFKRKAIEIIDSAGPKDDCSRHLKAWVTDVFNFKKLWAMRMLDANAKFQTGFLTGNIFHFGNYDQCLGIEEIRGGDVIQGQYCTVAITPAKNSTSSLAQVLNFATSLSEMMDVPESKDMQHIIRLVKMIYGICIPKSCSAESIQKLWNYAEFAFRLPIHVSTGDNFCTYKGKVPFAYSFDETVFWLFGIFLSFLCFANIYEMMFVNDEEEHGTLESFLLAFSIRKNTKKIFEMHSKNDDQKFTCLQGLKALSMLWVVFGHRYALSFFSGNVNMLDYFEWRKTLPALFILIAPFSVDTFLCISGLLLAYKYMQIRDMLSSKQSFPYFAFYFMRFLRLWPALIPMILLYISVLKYLNDGPLWTLLTYRMSESCKYTGWASALFFTNFINFHFQCIEPTWYLSVDTQLYCIAPLLLYFLYKYPKRSAFGYTMLTIILSLHAYYTTVAHKERWTPSEGDDIYHMRIYQSTFIRMPVWILGVLTGGFLYNYQNLKISKGLAVLMWTSIFTLFMSVIVIHIFLLHHPYNEYYSGLFNSTARPAWGAAICLLIILCSTGNGGYINYILSRNFFKPITKVSYSVYLTHSAVIYFFQGSKRTPTYHDTFRTFQGYLSEMPFTFVASLVWCLAFESPFINMSKLFMKNASGNKAKAIENVSEKSFNKFKKSTEAGENSAGRKKSTKKRE
ncbi:unnamed protein product [Ceutorhynchus assimilis]|uniref:Nose resistant-to-fluoxetine protein N-terminal domain-containing protein n=1 Tax=Ceutorhynchus assimilis TaxID=467358 RepID=A0A9N9MUD1_9CUCU|nr:unnamed protein product [Ceutorhynchus assimilis]